MEIKIDKNIPIPTCKYLNTYPFDRLGITDSFFIKTPKGLSSSSFQSFLSSYGRRYVLKFRLTKKFTVRKEKNGYRVWRTA